jgi:hypothetical protein
VVDHLAGITGCSGQTEGGAGGRGECGEDESGAGGGEPPEERRTPLDPAELLLLLGPRGRDAPGVGLAGYDAVVGHRG